MKNGHWAWPGDERKRERDEKPKKWNRANLKRVKKALDLLLVLLLLWRTGMGEGLFKLATEQSSCLGLLIKAAHEYTCNCYVNANDEAQCLVAKKKSNENFCFCLVCSMFIVLSYSSASYSRSSIVVHKC